MALLVVALLALAGCSASPPAPRLASDGPQPTQQPPAAAANQMVIAIDDLGVGFNPHVAAHQSWTTTAVATMTLPNAFNEVTLGNSVVSVPNQALVTNVEQTSARPFTITYQLNRDAQWSDGVPITAEDFTYLWQQMISQPNAVGAAGYKLISAVKSSGGGKTVTVEFSQPYPAWRTLFSALLPAHSLRAIPDGFVRGFDAASKVSGGPFQVRQVDRSRGLVALIRNDRYWGAAPKLDQITLRRNGSPAEITTALRARDLQAVSAAGGPALASQLSGVPGVQVADQPVNRVLGLTVNTRTDAMAIPDVRHAVLALLDRKPLIYAGANDAAVLTGTSQVFPPSVAPAALPGPDVRLAESLLSRAGFTRSEHPGASSTAPASPTTTTTPTTTTPPSPAPSTGETDSTETPLTTPTTPTSVPPLPSGVRGLSKDGVPLVLRVGYVEGDPVTASVANAVVDQLLRFGIAAEVTGYPVLTLYRSALLAPDVDLIVGWNGIGRSLAADVASRVDCPEQPWATRITAPGESNLDNVSGQCDEKIYQLAQRALAAPDPVPLLRQLDPLLAEQYDYLPVYQDRLVTAISDQTVQVPLTGPLGTGIFGAASQWRLSK